MVRVYSRACLTLLAVCAAVATTADDGVVGPRDGDHEQLPTPFVMPSAVMANLLMNVSALTSGPTAADASPSAETIEPGFVLLSSIDRYLEDAIERRNTITMTSPWSDFSKLHTALAAGADVEMVQAYVNDTCGGVPVQIIYWGQDGGGGGAEHVAGKLGYGSFERSHDSVACETAYVDRSIGLEDLLGW